MQDKKVKLPPIHSSSMVQSDSVAEDAQDDIDAEMHRTTQELKARYEQIQSLNSERNSKMPDKDDNEPIVKDDGNDDEWDYPDDFESDRDPTSKRQDRVITPKMSVRKEKKSLSEAKEFESVKFSGSTRQDRVTTSKKSSLGEEKAFSSENEEEKNEHFPSFLGEPYNANNNRDLHDVMDHSVSGIQMQSSLLPLETREDERANQSLLMLEPTLNEAFSFKNLVADVSQEKIDHQFTLTEKDQDEKLDMSANNQLSAENIAMTNEISSGSLLQKSAFLQRNNSKRPSSAPKHYRRSQTDQSGFLPQIEKSFIERLDILDQKIKKAQQDRRKDASGRTSKNLEKKNCAIVVQDLKKQSVSKGSSPVRSINKSPTVNGSNNKPWQAKKPGISPPRTHSVPKAPATLEINKLKSGLINRGVIKPIKANKNVSHDMGKTKGKVDFTWSKKMLNGKKIEYMLILYSKDKTEVDLFHQNNFLKKQIVQMKTFLQHLAFKETDKKKATPHGKLAWLLDEIKLNKHVIESKTEEYNKLCGFLEKASNVDYMINLERDIQRVKEMKKKEERERRNIEYLDKKELYIHSSGHNFLYQANIPTELDAMNRIGRVKAAIDRFKRQENKLKEQNSKMEELRYEQEKHLKRLEDRYNKLLVQSGHIPTFRDDEVKTIKEEDSQIDLANLAEEEKERMLETLRKEVESQERHLELNKLEIDRKTGILDELNAEIKQVIHLHPRLSEIQMSEIPCEGSRMPQYDYYNSSNLSIDLNGLSGNKEARKMSPNDTRLKKKISDISKNTIDLEGKLLVESQPESSNRELEESIRIKSGKFNKEKDNKGGRKTKILLNGKTFLDTSLEPHKTIEVIKKVDEKDPTHKDRKESPEIRKSMRKKNKMEKSYELENSAEKFKELKKLYIPRNDKLRSSSVKPDESHRKNVVEDFKPKKVSIEERNRLSQTIEKKTHVKASISIGNKKEIQQVIFQEQHQIKNEVINSQEYAKSLGKISHEGDLEKSSVKVSQLRKNRTSQDSINTGKDQSNFEENNQTGSGDRERSVIYPKKSKFVEQATYSIDEKIEKISEEINQTPHRQESSRKTVTENIECEVEETLNFKDTSEDSKELNPKTMVQAKKLQKINVIETKEKEPIAIGTQNIIGKSNVTTKEQKLNSSFRLDNHYDEPTKIFQNRNKIAQIRKGNNIPRANEDKLNESILTELKDPLTKNSQLGRYDNVEDKEKATLEPFEDFTVPQKVKEAFKEKTVDKGQNSFAQQEQNQNKIIKEDLSSLLDNQLDKKSEDVPMNARRMKMNTKSVSSQDKDTKRTESIVSKPEDNSNKFFANVDFDNF